MKNICVFCGARAGEDASLVDLTYNLGKEIVKNKQQVVCGGSNIGLMKAVTDGALSMGGNVIGVFPAILNGVEDPHPGIKEFIRTPCLPTRKQKMVDISDAFLILPGGYGTLDEIFEVVVLRRLNANKKQILIMNYNNFYSPLLQQIEKMVVSGFISQDEANLISIANNFTQLKLKLREIT